MLELYKLAMKLVTKVLLSVSVISIIGLQWPIGFAVGQTVKERALCQQVAGNTTKFKFAASGIMRGEKADGTFRSVYYVDGFKKGMLWSLKNCYEKKG